VLFVNVVTDGAILSKLCEEKYMSQFPQGMQVSMHIYLNFSWACLLFSPMFNSGDHQ